MADKEFLDWYRRMAKANGLNPDPYNPQHQYDYEAYWQKYIKGKPGMENHFGIPQSEHHEQRRFPDEFKVQGYDTKTKDQELERRYRIPKVKSNG